MATKEEREKYDPPIDNLPGSFEDWFSNEIIKWISRIDDLALIMSWLGYLKGKKNSEAKVRRLEMELVTNQIDMGETENLQKEVKRLKDENERLKQRAKTYREIENNPIFED